MVVEILRPFLNVMPNVDVGTVLGFRFINKEAIKKGRRVAHLADLA